MSAMRIGIPASIAVTLLASCASWTPAPPRAAVDSDDIAVVGSYDVYQDVQSQSNGPSLDLGSVEHEGYDAELWIHDASSYPAVVFRLGGRYREYDELRSMSARELTGGIMLHTDDDDLALFVSARVRYGLGLEAEIGNNSIESDAYWAYSASGGLVLWFDDHLLLKAEIAYEDFLERIEVGTEDVRLEGWVGSVGVGLRF